METAYSYLLYLAGDMPTSRLKALRKAASDTNLRSRMQHGYEGNRSENEHNRFGKIIYLKQCKASLEDHQAREIDN